MRGRADDQPVMFHVFDVEDRIRADHPLREVKRRADRLLAGPSPQFAAAYKPDRAAERPARTAAQISVADGPVFGPQRGPIVRPPTRRPSVSMVPGLATE